MDASLATLTPSEAADEYARISPPDPSRIPPKYRVTVDCAVHQISLPQHVENGLAGGAGWFAIIAHPLPHATIAVDAYRGVRHMPGLGVQLANGIDEQQRLVQRIHMAHIGDELGLLLHQCVMRRPVGRVKNGFHR